MNREEVGMIYTLICASWRLKVDKDILRAWGMILADEDYESILKAALLHSRNIKGHQAPSPADLIATSRQIQQREKWEAESPSKGKTVPEKIPERDCMHEALERDGDEMVCPGCGVRMPYFANGHDAIAYIRSQLKFVRDL